MKTMSVVRDGCVFRWRGGSFIAAWAQTRADEQVPDSMIDVPESYNRSKMTRDDVEKVVADWLASQSGR